MRISTIWYTFKQGFKNIKRNWTFSLASVITMAACILLFGIFYSIINNVNHIAQRIEQDVPVTVFFEEGTTEEQMQQTGAEIEQRPEGPVQSSSLQTQPGRNLKTYISRVPRQQKDLKMTTRWPIPPVTGSM